MEQQELTDLQIERLFAGEASDELAPLATVFASLRSADAPAVDVKSAAVAAAAESISHGVPIGAATRRPFFTSLRQRAAAIALGATVMLTSTGGLAVAADGAKPGDFLYGIDRALEAVGVNNGSDMERLEEVEALIEAGDVARGLQHAAEAVEKDETGNGAAAALLDAADRVRSGGAEQSAATREQVATLLTYISENAGSVDGQQVAELAREINGPKSTTGPPEDAPVGPPESTPADPPGVGPANPPGRADDAPGPPEHSPADPPGHAEGHPGNPPKKDN